MIFVRDLEKISLWIIHHTWIWNEWRKSDEFHKLFLHS